MKKIFLGFLALSMLSSTAVFANGNKKKAKAKTAKSLLNDEYVTFR